MVACRVCDGLGPWVRECAAPGGRPVVVRSVHEAAWLVW
jgi:hypothetical protein